MRWLPAGSATPCSPACWAAFRHQRLRRPCGIRGSRRSDRRMHLRRLGWSRVRDGHQCRPRQDAHPRNPTHSTLLPHPRHLVVWMAGPPALHAAVLATYPSVPGVGCGVGMIPLPAVPDRATCRVTSTCTTWSSQPPDERARLQSYHRAVRQGTRRRPLYAPDTTLTVRGRLSSTSRAYRGRAPLRGRGPSTPASCSAGWAAHVALDACVRRFRPRRLNESSAGQTSSRPSS